MNNINNQNLPVTFSEVEELDPNSNVPIVIDRRKNFRNFISNKQKKVILKKQEEKIFEESKNNKTDEQFKDIEKLNFGIDEIDKLAKVNKYWNYVNNKDTKNLLSFWIKRLFYSSIFRIFSTIFFVILTISMFCIYWLYPFLPLAIIVIILILGSIFAILSISMVIYHLFLVI